ncbi:MAG: ABC transporter permease subunit [Clostridiales bacterium]|nr:ABC transporter permease subunit [Clostridiales bacterium]
MQDNNRKNSWVIVRKELLRVFTDRKLLFTTVIMPGLIIFIIYTLLGGVFSNVLSGGGGSSYRIEAVNMPEDVAALFAADGLTYDEIWASEVDTACLALTDGALDLCVVFPEDFDESVAAYEISSGEDAPEIQLFYNSGGTASVTCYQTVVSLLDSYENTLANKFDINRSEGTYDMISEGGISFASRIMVAIIPMLFVTLLFSAGSSVAPDLIAGEKERGTMATLLVTPMKRSSLALGKIISMSLLTLLSGISSFLGLILSLPSFGALGGGTQSLFDFSGLGTADYGLMLVMLIAVVLLMVSILSILSAQAKSVKEASTIISSVTVVVMMVGMVGGYTGMSNPNPITDIIPIYGFSRCMSAVLCGTSTASGILLTVISSLSYSAICICILTKMFDSERVMFKR